MPYAEKVRSRQTNGRRKRYSDADRRRARLMREHGATYAAIAKEIGCSVMTVAYWCNSETREQQRESSRQWKEDNPERRSDTATAYRRKHGRAQNSREVARRRRGRAALRRQEQDNIARIADGSAAGAYALIRRAVQQLDRASATRKDARVALAEAISALHAAEDAVADAIREGVD